MNRRDFLRAGASALALSMLPASLLALDTSEKKPNFLIIMADDVSWSSFGCADSGLFTRTPNIDTLATEGVRFTNFFCASAQCAPVRHELYTGLLPPSSGVYDNGNKPRAKYRNVVDYLGAAGYNVGLAGKLHFKSESKFAEVPGFTSNANHSAPTWSLDGARHFISKAQAKDQPFCLFLCSVHAHHPWTIGDSSRFPVDEMVLPPHMVDGPVTRACMSEHAAEVEDLDNQVGATMQLLKDMKLEEDTVLIFLSEQGTAMPNGKWSIYDFGCRALCTVRWPGKIKPGTTTDAIAMYCDIVPTLVDLAGGTISDKIDGRSLSKVLLSDDTSESRKHALLFGQKHLKQRALRKKDYKLIWNPNTDEVYNQPNIMGSKGNKRFHDAWQEWVEKAKTDPVARAKVDRIIKHPEFELYDIRTDPFETKNLADNPEHSQRVKNMLSELKKELAMLKDELAKE